MRKAKRFLEKENMFIYVGTTIFIALAIGLGIIMYMTTKGGLRIENGSGQAEQHSQENIENVTSEIGKTVEEQENNITQVEETTENTEKQVNTTSQNKTEEQQQPIEKNQKEITEKEENTQIETPVQGQITETKKEITFTKPAEGAIICEYAKDNLIYSETLKEWITHTAIDIKADKTSVIKSAADGIIKSIVNDPRYGLTVVIQHEDGYETVYSNLLTAEFIVVGEEVTQGQTIGTVGNTAAFESNMDCHLHFELLKDGEYLDPTIYLK